MKQRRTLRVSGTIIVIIIMILFVGCGELAELVETIGEEIEELLNSASELASFDLELPESAAVDALGRLYVIANGQLEIYGRDGTTEPLLTVDEIGTAIDVALDSDGYIYVLHEEAETNQLALFEPFDGTSGITPPRLRDIRLPDETGIPTGISVDPIDGGIYVLERSDPTIPTAGDISTRIQVYRGRGDGTRPERTLEHIRTIDAHEVEQAVDLVANDGDVYVVDQARDTVRVYDIDQIPTDSARADSSSTIGGPNVLTHPTAVAIDDTGSVYIADSARIQMFNARFEYERTLELDGENEGFGRRLTGLAVDSERHLLVADAEAGKARLVRVEETAVCSAADQRRQDEDGDTFCFKDEGSGENRTRRIFHPRGAEPISGMVRRLERLNPNGRPVEVTHYSYRSGELERAITKHIDENGEEIDLWIETDGVRTYRYPDDSGAFRDCALPDLPCVSHAALLLVTSAAQQTARTEIALYNPTRQSIDWAIRTDDAIGVESAWLTIDATSGTALAANESALIMLTADATDRDPGTYQTFLTIEVDSQSQRIMVSLIHQ